MIECKAITKSHDKTENKQKNLLIALYENYQTWKLYPQLQMPKDEIIIPRIENSMARRFVDWNHLMAGNVESSQIDQTMAKYLFHYDR